MFYTLIKHRFLTNQSTRLQGTIYIIKVDRNTVHIFYILNNSCLRGEKLNYKSGAVCC